MLGFVGDVHTGARSGSEFVRQFIKNYIICYLLPLYQSMGITQIIQAGDFFDVRRSLFGRDRDWLTKEFIPACEKYGIEWHIIVGNHDITLSDSNNINWVDWLAEESNGYVVDYGKPMEMEFENKKFLMLPWINKDNYDECVDIIESTDAEYCVGHLELAGFPMYQGSVSEKGIIGIELLRKFKRVITGHYHTISDTDISAEKDGSSQLTYLGTPYHLNWQDHKDGTNRGVWTLDVNTNDLVLHKNNESQSLFRVWEYDDSQFDTAMRKGVGDKDYLNDVLGFKGQIVHINITNRESASTFKKFKDALMRAETIDYMIADNTKTINSASIVVREEVIQQDVLELMVEKVDATEGIRKSEVSKKLKSIHSKIEQKGLVSENS